MPKSLSLILIFLCTAKFALTAQIETFVPMEWGVIPKSDLEMSGYSLDSTAQAVVLGVEGRMLVQTGARKYEYSLIKHKRIKILDQAAIDTYGNVTIYYYHKDNMENVRQIKAQTISPDGQIEKINSKEVYREKINDRWSQVTFAFTNIEVGSILEYRYQLYSDRPFSPNEWHFREEIPVRSSYFKFRVTAPMAFTYHMSGAKFMKHEKKIDNQDHLTIGNMHLWIKGTEFLMTDAAALTEEPYMTTIDDYRLTVRFQCHEYDRGDGRIERVLHSWEETANDLLQDNRLGLQFSKKNRSNKVIDASRQYVDESAEASEQLFQIAQFISKSILWNGQYGIYTSTSPNDAYQLKEGSLASIQYAGLALLRHYGIEAHPVILSTRDNGAMITGFPFIDQYNYVVLLINIDGQVKLIDMSDPLLPIGILRQQALNKNGFVLKKESGWLDIKTPIFQDVHAIKAEIHEDGSLTAEMKNTMRTYSAYSDRQALRNNNSEKIWTDRLPEGNTITASSAKNIEDIRQALVVDLNFELPDACTVAGDFMYLSPILYTNFDENPFKLEERSFPIDFPYPFEEKSIYSYTLPDGYTVEALPDNIDIRLPNQDAIFQYLAKSKDGKIQIVMILRVEKTIFSPDEYSALRDLFEEAVEKIGEQIVLKKS